MSWFSWVEDAFNETVNWVSDAANDTVDFVEDVYNEVEEFTEQVIDGITYFITGEYDGDEGDNTLTAIGFAIWGSGIRTYGGNDTVYAASLKLNIVDTWGNLSVYGAAGFMDIDKTEWGNISVYGLAGAVSIRHTGSSGNITYGGIAAYNKLYLSGDSGNISFSGAGIANQITNCVDDGDIDFIGAGMSNVVERIGGRRGDIDFDGFGASNQVTNSADDGDINFFGVGGYNKVNRLGGYRGDISFKAIGIANHVKNTAKYGNIDFIGGGGANIIYRSGSGNVSFKGIGVANVVTQKGERGNLDFIGGGGANVIKNTVSFGDVNIVAAGIANYIERSGKEGNGNLILLGGGNIVIWSTHGKLDAKLGGLRINTLNRTGSGNTNLILVSLGNIVNVNVAKGDLSLAGIGVANIVTYKGRGTLNASLAGGANIITRQGFGDSILYLLAGANVFTDSSIGNVSGSLVGGMNVVTKKNDGNIDIAMLGGGNILTHVGDGDVTAGMLGGANVLTKVGNGDVWALMFGALNVFTRVGNGNDYLLMLGAGNIASKVGDGDVIIGMIGVGNVMTHIGDGMTIALMVSVGANVFTKVGNGPTLALMFSPGLNFFTHIGDGPSAALMIGGMGNVFTKVGNGTTVAVMLAGQANVFTHVGDGFSAALMIGGQLNVFTKVGDGTTLAAMVGNANIFTHIGNGFSTALAIGQGNLITKVGSGNLITAAIGQVNIVTHVNLDGGGNTASLVVGRANVITRISSLDNFTVTVSPLDSVVSDPVLKKHRLFPRGGVFSAPQKFLDSGIDALKATGAALLGKGKEGSMVTFAVGQANIITHVGNGAMLAVGIGKANIISKVGLGQTIQVGIGKANILTSVGDNDSLQIAVGKVNLVTKVGSGYSAMIAIGKANITTKVGDGFHMGLSVGKSNINTNIGDGIAINVMAGKYNLNTRVGHGVNIAVMKGDYNANIHYGDGMDVALAAGKGNISIKIGDGDYYGAMLELGTKESPIEKMKSLMQGMFSNLTETAKGMLVSSTITAIVSGDDADTVKTRRGGYSVPNSNKNDYDDTSDIKSTNKEVDQSKYNDKHSNQETNIQTNKNKDQATSSNLKSDTKINEADANQDSQTIMNTLGSDNGDDLMLAQRDQANSDTMLELNRIGQSDHHNSYDRFCSSDQVKKQANQDIKDSKSGIDKSKTESQKNLDKGKKNLKESQSHQQKERQDAIQELERNDRKFDELNINKNNQDNQDRPMPLTKNAWRINCDNGVLGVGDKIEITLTLNKAVTLANIGRNKIIIAGKDFLLTGVNGSATKILSFTYTVQVNDKISAKDFDIDNKYNIILAGIKDTNSNAIDLSNITGPVNFSNIALKTDFTLGGNKITQTNGVYEKTSGTGWNADVYSSKGFVGDGYVIAKIGAVGNKKRMMFGLSSDNTNSSYDSIDYALYADGGIGNKFIIYESKRKKHQTGVVYTAGDYMKLVREGTTIKYYHIKAVDGPLATGTLLYTSSQASNANTKLFLDSSLYDIGTKLSDVQIFGPTISIDVHAPKPIANAWHVNNDNTPSDSLFSYTVGDKITVTLTLDEMVILANVGRNDKAEIVSSTTASNKIVIAGRDFLLTGTNGNVTKTLDFTYIVQANDKFKGDFSIGSITLTDTKDAEGNAIDFSGIAKTIELGNTPSKNIISPSNGLATVTTNIDEWHINDTASSLRKMTDGNTSSSGMLDYAVHPLNADGKYILFDFNSDYKNVFFKLYNRKNNSDRINGSIVKFIKNGVVISTHTISNAGNIVEVYPPANILFDQVKLTFKGDLQNFREIEIFGVEPGKLLIDSHAVKPLNWHVSASNTINGVATIGDEIKVILTLDETITLANVDSNKIVIAGKDFQLKGTNGASTKTLEFAYIVQANDNINSKDFNIKSKRDIVLRNIKDTDGNLIDFSGMTSGIELGDVTITNKNIALNSNSLATITTNISAWYNGDTAANIKKMTDGHTHAFGANNYAVHPWDANGKHILFDFKGIDYNNGSFKLYNRTNFTNRINGSTVEFIKDGRVLSTHVIRNAGRIVEISPADNVLFDQVKLTFKGNAQNFREVEIFGTSQYSVSIDSGAPKPLTTNAWHVDTANATKGVFGVGDEIKVILTLDESVILANVGNNKIVINGKNFLLTGANGAITNTLNFTHTVKTSDRSIHAKDFNINSKNDIILTNIKDVDGNNIDLSAITGSVKLSNTPLKTNFTLGGGNKITQTNGVYEKTSSTGWDADIFSSKGFTNDGYVIAKIGSFGKVMLGLSSDNSNSSYQGIDYALYADSDNGGKLVIYEQGRKKQNPGVSYAVGDYMKVVREGATVKYYHIKATEGPLATGALLYTSGIASDTNTKLFLDSSFCTVGTKLSDVQIFKDTNPPISIDLKTKIDKGTQAEIVNSLNQGNDLLNQTTETGTNQTNTNVDGGNTAPNPITPNEEVDDTTGNTQNKTEKPKDSKPKKWFTNRSINREFSKDLPLYQSPQVFIITDYSYNSLNVALWLKQENDIVLYYNTDTNEIEYLYGQENDIETSYIEYKIITNGEIVGTLVEDTINAVYIVNADEDAKDDENTEDDKKVESEKDNINEQNIVAQLQQTLIARRVNVANLRKNWLTRHSFKKNNLEFDSLFTPSEQDKTPSSDTNTQKKSNYETNIIVQNSDNETVVEATIALFRKHPNNSIIVKFDQNGNLVTLKGDRYTPKGNTRVNFVDHGSSLSQEGAQALANKAKKIHQTYGNDTTSIKRFALVGCDTDGINQTLTKDFAKAVYEKDILKNVEVTGRKGEVQINADGTKTMAVGGEKMIYQWNEDLKLITQQTEESKRVAEVLEGLKLGGASSKGASKGGVDIDSIPDILTNAEVDMSVTIGDGTFKDAYAFKNKPNLLVLLLSSGIQASDIANEMERLKQLNQLGMKTPEYYKKISFVDKKSSVKRHGVVMQKIKGAKEVILSERYWISVPKILLPVLDNSNGRTLQDIQHLQKIFVQNPSFAVSDFQGLVAEDGQLYIIDPMDITNQGRMQNSDTLDALQVLEESILAHHKRFLNKTTHHITYIDKQLWTSDNTLKQQVLSDAQKDKNKVIVSYDFTTGKKSVVYHPDNSQRLVFDTVEVITSDANIQSADLEENCLEFAKQQGWKEGNKPVFRANTRESYAVLDLKVRRKNKYSIILQLGSSDIAKKAAQSLYKKHPKNSIIVTLDEQGRLVFPAGMAFNPDDSVRFNIVGHYDDLQQAGAQKLVDYTDQAMQHYNVNSIDSNAYLNRVALVGCKSEEFSQKYAERLYGKPHLRGVEVTGREGDMQVNPNGTKTMQVGKKKIIHSWNFENQKMIRETSGARHTGKILNRIKLGLDDNIEALNLPKSLKQENIGEEVGAGNMKTAYTLNDHPNLLFLQLKVESEDGIEMVKNEVDWVNKLKDLGIKAPKYYKKMTMLDQNNQKHSGVLVERIHNVATVKPIKSILSVFKTFKRSYVTKKTHSDIQNLLKSFKRHSNLYIPDLQMLIGRDGQLYVFDPMASYPPLLDTDDPDNQETRVKNIVNLENFSEISASILKEFDQGKNMRAVFVDQEMLEKDPEFEKKLLDKAKKQQDLVVVSYDSDKASKILFEPKTSYSIDRIEVMVDENNRFIKLSDMLALKSGMNVSRNMVFRHTLKENFSNYQTHIIVQHGDSEVAIKAAKDLANKHPDSSIIVRFDADGKLITPTDGFYTPKGNVRLSFVDHGSNFSADSEQGGEKLTDKVQKIYDTYATSNNGTYLERIALVGCDTDGIKQDLTRKFAQSVYARIPALQDATITGRKGEIQVNDNGTKTMQTNGQKTIYSWNDGKLVAETKEAKTTADTLEHSLSNFDGQIKKIRLLMEKKGPKSKHYSTLVDVLNAFYSARDTNFENALNRLELSRSILTRHLTNLESNIRGQLAGLLDFTNRQIRRVESEITERGALFLELEKRLVHLSEISNLDIGETVKFYKKLLEYSEPESQYKDNPKIAELQGRARKEITRVGGSLVSIATNIAKKEKSYTTDVRIKVLTRANTQMNSLKDMFLKYFDNNTRNKIRNLQLDIPMRLQQAKLQRHHDRLAELKAWKQNVVVDTYETPLVGFDHVVVMQLEDDPTIVRSSSGLAGKNFGKHTLVQADKWGNFQVVSGTPLDQVEGKVKVILQGHGGNVQRIIAGRSSADIVKHIIDLKNKLVSTKVKTIEKVSIKGCNPGPDFGKEVAIGLHKNGINTSVSSRLDDTRGVGVTSGTFLSGKQTTSDYYHVNTTKTIWGYNKKGKLFQQGNTYTDTNYHAVLSIDANGNPNIEKTFENKSLSSFKGGLKILVKAGNHQETLKMLSIFEKQLQNEGASPMQQINIKMGKGEADWIAKSDTLLAYGKLTEDFSKKFQANIRLSSDSGPHEGTAVFKFIKEPKENIYITTPEYGINIIDYSDDSIGVSHLDNRTSFTVSATEQLEAGAKFKIFIYGDDYSAKELLSALGDMKEIVGKHAISDVNLYVNDVQAPTKEHEELAGYLAKKFNIQVVLSYKDVGVVAFTEAFKKNPLDFDVIALDFSHLAETTPHQDKNLQDWS
ncbi:MAG: hypothetical protein FE834_10775, partial [Gammaproteobacteria bacterium]|nr:hypothetical protein [Gammaproteobacteria bacterium]